MTEAVIIDACRTPRGLGKRGKGSLSHLHPQYVGATVLKALADRSRLDTADVDDVIWGTNIQMGTQTNDLGRLSALAAGYDIKSSGTTLTRFCGSGLTAVNLGAAAIMSGMEDVIVSGGTEMMSMYETLKREPFLDLGNLALRKLHPMSHQGICADAIASLEGIDRKAVDALALLSQQRTAKAIETGAFKRSLIPVVNEDGSLALEQDEYPRPGTTMEILSGLEPAFGELADKPLDSAGITYRSLVLQKYPELKINHVHHAGNSSGVVDGAAALLLTSSDYAKAQGLSPRARIVAYANMGDCPTLMLTAPGPSIKKVLKKARLSVADIDLFEINEAFAAIPEKVIRDLGLDRDKVNVNGGAIALGHPIGATGAILTGTLLDELERRDQQFGLVTMCTGGGMAPSLIIERV